MIYLRVHAHMHLLMYNYTHFQCTCIHMYTLDLLQGVTVLLKVELFIRYVLYVVHRGKICFRQESTHVHMEVYLTDAYTASFPVNYRDIIHIIIIQLCRIDYRNRAYCLCVFITSCS